MTVDIERWLQPGARWFVHMADFDVADDYRIDLAADPDGLAIAWGFAPKAADRPFSIEGSARFGADALDAGDGVVFLSQGSAMGRDDDADSPFARHTPPFLVSRAFRAAITGGGTARLTLYGEVSELVQVGIENRTIRVDGVDREIEVVHAEGSAEGGDVGVWFVDHPRWPVLVRAEFQGDNEISLAEVLTEVGTA